MLGGSDVISALNELERNKWVDLLAEGVAELARELKAKTMLVPDIVKWLAEWSRDTRGEQRGLLLLTAHRAKGLEFDHVAILNGGWDGPSKNEDHHAPRRLFYVAMTRAQKSLVVMTSGEHALLKVVSSSILCRNVRPVNLHPKLALTQIWCSFGKLATIFRPTLAEVADGVTLFTTRFLPAGPKADHIEIVEDTIRIHSRSTKAAVACRKRRDDLTPCT